MVLQELSAGDLRVVEVDFQNDPRWEAFVSAHPDATVFHHPAWLMVLIREYPRQPITLACEDSAGRLHGILPLLETRGLPFNWGSQILGRRLTSLPRTPCAGPLGSNAQATELLVRAAVDLVKARPGVVLQLKSGLDNLDSAVKDLRGVPFKRNFVLDLPAEPGNLRFGNARNHSRIRWAVNKAEKSGVSLRIADKEADLLAWYRLHAQTMRHHSAVPRSYRFFKALWDFLRPRGMMRLLLAERQKGFERELLVGSLFLMFGRTVLYYLNGRRPEAFGLRANDLIQWRSIHDAHREGFRIYDFGEVEEDQQGLVEFKEKWGARPVRSTRYYYPAPDDLKNELAEKPSPLVGVANAFWGRMPVQVTTRLGDWIYSFL
jgi:hypothetical protein